MYIGRIQILLTGPMCREAISACNFLYVHFLKELFGVTFIQITTIYMPKHRKVNFVNFLFNKQC